jgi:hypothetical protein
MGSPATRTSHKPVSCEPPGWDSGRRLDEGAGEAPPFGKGFDFRSPGIIGGCLGSLSFCCFSRLLVVFLWAPGPLSSPPGPGLSSVLFLFAEPPCKGIQFEICEIVISGPTFFWVVDLK